MIEGIASIKCEADTARTLSNFAHAVAQHYGIDSVDDMAKGAMEITVANTKSKSLLSSSVFYCKQRIGLSTARGIIRRIANSYVSLGYNSMGSLSSGQTDDNYAEGLRCWVKTCNDALDSEVTCTILITPQ